MKPDPKARLEAVRVAMEELGPAGPEQLAAFVKERFGIDIPLVFMPLFKATVLDKERLDAERAKRIAPSPLPSDAAAGDAPEKPVQG